MYMFNQEKSNKEKETNVITTDCMMSQDTCCRRIMNVDREPHFALFSVVSFLSDIENKSSPFTREQRDCEIEVIDVFDHIHNEPWGLNRTDLEG